MLLIPVLLCITKKYYLLFRPDEEKKKPETQEERLKRWNHSFILNLFSPGSGMVGERKEESGWHLQDQLQRPTRSSGGILLTLLCHYASVSLNPRWWFSKVSCWCCTESDLFWHCAFQICIGHQNTGQGRLQKSLGASVATQHSWTEERGEKGEKGEKEEKGGKEEEKKRRGW